MSLHRAVVVLSLALFGPAASVALGTSKANFLKAARAARGQARAQTQPEAAVRTLLTLDANHDGQVDSEEVKSFAISQGLDSAAATKEFAVFDTNGDGALDSTELSAALGGVPAPAAPAQAVTPAQADAPAAPKTVSTGTDGYNTRVDAHRAASTVVDQLGEEAQMDREAQALEHKASELRANSTELARKTEEMAAAAAAQAASEKADQLLQQLTVLEDKAKHAEIEAAALRAKAKAELDQADELMAVADDALKGQRAQ